VWKGKRMAGHMGVEIITIQKLKVVQVDAEKNIMLIRGALPGNNKAPVFITSTVKKIPIIQAAPAKKQGKDKAKEKTKEKAAPAKPKEK
jgi:large subunit ribosomal protein L3